MKLGGARLFQTRVARRVMGLFLLCALVPIAALGVTSYLHVTGQLRMQALDRLRIESKSAGMSVIERLQLVESNLRGLHQTVMTAGGAPTPSLPLGFELADGVVGLATSQPNQRPAHLMGERIPTQPLSQRQRDHLSLGRSVVIVIPEEEPVILLAQALRPGRLDQGIIWAKLHPPFLWSTENGDSRLPAGVAMCIFSGDGTTLTCPYDDHDMPEGIPRQPGAVTEEEFGWTADGEEHLAAQWTVFLGFDYAVPSWLIVLGEPSAQVLAPLSDFKRSFPLVLLLTVVVVIWVSHHQVRSSMEPLKALMDGTESIAQQRFDTTVSVTSGDEFEDLAGSFNTMARQLGKQFNALTARSAIDRAVLSELDRDHIVATVLRRTNEALSCHRVSIALRTDAGDPESPWHVTTAHEGCREEYDVHLPESELDELAKHPDSMTIHRAKESRSYLRNGTSGNGGPVVVLPLHRKNDVTGLIAIEYGTREDADAELRQARQLADQVSVALSNAHLVEELDSLSTGALTALARTIDANSHWTAGHSERVTQVASVIASGLGLPQEDLDTLYRGGLLHDIGKIGVPPAILDKPGRLTDEEFEMVKQHPAIGARILAPIKAYADTIPIVLHHHERFDGKGYPHGLAGEEIPFLARVLCVADVWDALASDRPYRPSWPASTARKYMLKRAGIQFDPAVIEAFCRVLEDGLVEYPGNLEIDGPVTDSANWDADSDLEYAILGTGDR